MYEDLLPYTFATWIFTLHVAGIRAGDDAIRDACQGVVDAREATAGNAAGAVLIDAVKRLVPDGDAVTVSAAARALFGGRIGSTFDDPDRDVRVAVIRKYQFSTQLPWLARIWERNGGRAQPVWVLVERVTGEVSVADPNPWNAIDESRRYPLADFQVLWELDGLTHLHLTPAG
jgi:hypothetical protein